MKSEKTREEKKLSLSRKLALEFLYTASCINKSFFASVSRMRIHGNIPQQNMMIETLDVFLLIGGSSGFSNKFSSARYIYEANGIEVGMDIFFH